MEETKQPQMKMLPPGEPLPAFYANSFHLDASIFDVQVHFMVGGDRKTAVTVILPPVLVAQVARSLSQIAAAYDQQFGMPQKKEGQEVAAVAATPSQPQQKVNNSPSLG